MAKSRIVPIILAAGSSERLGYPKPLAMFGAKTALEIAAENCKGLARPILVLGCDAKAVKGRVPRGARVIVNEAWRTGQLSSLRRALRLVPKAAPFLVYPVDQPLLRRSMIQLLVRTYGKRPKGKEIVMPVYRGRDGHPVLVAGGFQVEFAKAKTSREAIYRDRARILRVKVRTRAVVADFGSAESYRACLRRFRRT